MNAGGVVLLVVGVLMCIGGMGIALSAQDAANSMSWLQRQLYPDDYNSYVSTAVIGWGIAVVGGILALVGVVVALTVGTKTPTQTTGQPGQMQYGPVAPGVSNFCSYCGQQTAPGALMCPRCGRKQG